MSGKAVSDVLAEVFRRGGMKRNLRRAQVVLAWQRVAGRELSRFTRARAFEGGVLFVDTSDSETAMHLSMQRSRFVQVYGELGMAEVREIRFRSGRGAVEGVAEKQAERVEADSGELAALQERIAGLDLPPELARPVLRAAGGIAMTRARRRRQGWTPCVVCGALCQGGNLCLSCERYSHEPGVLRAALELAPDPLRATPWLTEDQRAVAAWLAAGRLEGQLGALLSHALADDRARSPLEKAAVNLVSLRTGKPPAELTTADWHLLPPAVARVLGLR